MSSADDGEGVLADDMAAELLRLLRQNFQTTRDHIGYLVQLDLLERRPGRALRVALSQPIAAELDRALAQAGQAAQIAVLFRSGETAIEQTAISYAPPAPTRADGPSRPTG